MWIVDSPNQDGSSDSPNLEPNHNVKCPVRSSSKLDRSS